MSSIDQINLTFKPSLLKKWTLLEDKIIYDGKEIKLSEIQAVKFFCKPTFANNGVIQINVNNKIISLAYPNKAKEDGQKAFQYLQDNYGNKEHLSNNKKFADIQAEIDALPCKDNWGTSKEISELPSVLAIDEHIKAITSGVTDGNTWLIVCTNKRVIMLDKGMVYGLRLIDIPLDRINSISHSKGLILGKIAITDGATTRTIDNVSNVTVSFFADTVNKERQIYNESKTTPVTQVVNATSAADELLKFKQLLDMGVLTQEEFDMKKKELLGL